MQRGSMSAGHDSRLPSPEEWTMRMTFADRVDYCAKHILTSGLGISWTVYAWHLGILLTNYGIYVIVALLVPKPADMSVHDHRALLFSKLVVWQHVAEAIGCRQGPLNGHWGLPNNYRYRFQIGACKHPLFPFLGSKRNVLDCIVHLTFFVSSGAFLLSQEYRYSLIRMVVACDLFILVSDHTQFYGGTANAYGMMLVSMCFPAANGRLAGIQLALIMQWFFSGAGKIGPWFAHVNGPFVLQSRILSCCRRWLFKIFVTSLDDLRPSMFGIVFAHTAAAVEYLAPLLLMTSNPPLVWTGLLALTSMHFYILVMPAPGDVYSWNLCFALSGVYLFYFGGALGFDWQGFASMSYILRAALCAEFTLCCWAAFNTEKVGHLASHRYWAGNWMQTIFFVRKTEATCKKLDKVHTFSSNPLSPAMSVPMTTTPQFCGWCAMFWLGNLNLKCLLRLIEEALKLSGSTNLDDWQRIQLESYCMGEWRDYFWTEAIMGVMQEQIGFDEGECFCIRVGSFPICGRTTMWRIWDMKKGILAEGKIGIDALAQMTCLPSQALGTSFDIDTKLSPLL